MNRAAITASPRIELERAARAAYKLLDSVAFVSVEGDTDGVKAALAAALGMGDARAATADPASRVGRKMPISKIRAAIRESASGFVRCEALTAWGIAGGQGRWAYGYEVRRDMGAGKTRVSLGLRNAEEYLRTVANDAPIIEIPAR